MQPVRGRMQTQTRRQGNRRAGSGIDRRIRGIGGYEGRHHLQNTACQPHVRGVVIGNITGYGPAQLAGWSMPTTLTARKAPELLGKS